MSRPTFIDCFAGAGGLSLGITESGFESIFAFDAEPVACQTLRHNLGGVVEAARIEDLDPERIEVRFGKPDLVIGGPPCQGFSTQRRGAPTDPRNDLVNLYWAFALSFEPKVIVMENVPGVLGTRGTHQMDAVREMALESGYQIGSAVVDVTAIGVPQRRRRAIVVAWNPEFSKPFDFSCFISDRQPMTVRDAIGDIPPPHDDFTEHPTFANHIRVRMSERNLERIAHVPPGGGRLDIPEGLRLACHKGGTHRHLDVYGRLAWDEPAGTITAMFDNFTRGRFAHPTEDRNITSREGARLQSFPDWYEFSGAKKEVARQIGNAVPPLLGRVIGEEVARQLGLSPKELRPSRRSRHRHRQAG
jgi:DNA (cytosine-5)-methyltransferase 1